MNTILLIATSNPGKVTEINDLLASLPCRVIGLADLPQVLPTVEETGTTFAENALIKAEHYHQLTGLLTLADDSGLVVDVLDGRPGVYSARYGGAGLSSHTQIDLLLAELQDVPAAQRTARFVCCIALVGELAGEQLRETFERSCEGMIANEPRGAHGFGYDPIFIDAERGRTFAELSREEKAARSHRGQALRATREELEPRLKVAQTIALWRQYSDESAAERGARLWREAELNQPQIAAACAKAMEEMGISGEPVGVEKLHEMMIADGVNPEDNEFSRGIIEMREE